MSDPHIDNGWVETRFGMIDPLHPRPEDVNPLDIAWALSQVCRFQGHTAAFYSVAQHSMLVASAITGNLDELCLMGLLHDASKAYLCDVSAPVKPRLPGYVEIEDNMMRVIAERFELPWPFDPLVKVGDRRVLDTERRDLMPGRTPPWPDDPGFPLEDSIFPWDAAWSRSKYIERLHQALVATKRLKLASITATVFDSNR